MYGSDKYSFAVSVSDCENTADVYASLFDADGKCLGICIAQPEEGIITSVSFDKSEYPTAVSAKIIVLDNSFRPVAEQKEVKLA